MKSAETCFEKLVKSLQVNLFSAEFFRCLEPLCGGAAYVPPHQVLRRTKQRPKLDMLMAKYGDRSG